jgi:hypothetical protein
MRNEIFAQYCTRTGVGPAQVPARCSGINIRLAVAFACIFAFFIGSFSFTPAARAANLKPLFAKITAAIMGGNPTRVKWAQGQIESLLRGNAHNPTNAQLYDVWLRRMLLHHEYAVIVRITKMENLLDPGVLHVVWDYQLYRTQALLLMGRRRAALRNAKSLFNVAPDTQTAQAAMMVYRCLLVKKGDGAELAREFRREQIAGAKPPQPGQPPKACDVLAGIRVHGKAYVQDVQRQLGVGTRVLLAKGNLWLLADHPNKALKCFKSAYGIATPRQLPMVCDRIAAAMRAKYGTIGAANAWLKSLAK